MMEVKAIFRVRKPNPQVSLIEVEGQVTAFVEDLLMKAYNEATQDNPAVIIFNFTQMNFINSSGIGLLVTLLVRSRRSNQQLFAFGLNEHFEYVFELTRLNEVIRLFKTEEEALAGVTA
jgi:anti-sigma B factor antagonist